MSFENLGFEVPEAAIALLPAQKLADIQQAFADIDRNQDGKLDLEEYLGYLLSQQKEKLTKKFEALDRDHDGNLSFEEFLMASEPQYQILKKFREFDADQDGLLDLAEAAQIAESLDFPLGKTQLEALIKKTDRDSDGQLAYDEFLGAIARFGFQ